MQQAVNLFDACETLWNPTALVDVSSIYQKKNDNNKKNNVM